MSKRILVLSAHPKPNSFVHHLAVSYAEQASKQHQVQVMDLSQMSFDPDLSNGYSADQTMEESLQSFQSAIRWCEHLVIVTPIWWGALPAKLKGLFDRSFLPGFAFKYKSGSLMPAKLLKGRSARIIMTMDSPPWYYWLFQCAPGVWQLKTATLKFVGFKRVRSKMIGPIISSDENLREKWQNSIARLGSRAG